MSDTITPFWEGGLAVTLVSTTKREKLTLDLGRLICWLGPVSLSIHAGIHAMYRLDGQWCCFSVHTAYFNGILLSFHTLVHSQFSVLNYEKRAWFHASMHQKTVWLTVHPVSLTSIESRISRRLSFMEIKMVLLKGFLAISLWFINIH